MSLVELREEVSGSTLLQAVSKTAVGMGRSVEEVLGGCQQLSSDVLEMEEKSAPSWDGVED